eukprot:COSAG06_NODE_64029_length_260_cov_1.509317_1_plen_43_part_01
MEQDSQATHTEARRRLQIEYQWLCSGLPGHFTDVGGCFLLRRI